MSVHVRNIGWNIVGPSPSSLAVVMSSDVNGPLFFLKFHIHVTYMINIIHNMADLLYGRKIRSNDHNNKKITYVERISMSLRPKLLAEFDKSMIKAGFTDRSKAIQTALHSFVDEHNWMNDLP